MSSAEYPRKFSPQSGKTYLSYCFHIHNLNRKWWYEADGTPIQHNPKIRFALMTSELSEALEADRKNLADDHLPHLPGVVVELADFLIRLADNIIGYKWDAQFNEYDHLFVPDEPTSAKIWELMREVDYLYGSVLDDDTDAITNTISNIWNNTLLLMSSFDLDPWEVIYQKLAYNYTRADHTYEARAAAHGKKF